MADLELIRKAINFAMFELCDGYLDMPSGCEGCPLFYSSKLNDDGTANCREKVYREFVEKHMKAAPTIEQPTWISCAERLPDEHVDVQMCWKATGTQATGFYTDESWYTYAEDGYYTDCEKAPTHWKAVGEPPKGDE